MRAMFSREGTVIPFLGLLKMIAIIIIFSLIYYKYIEKLLYRRAIKWK